MANIPTLKPYAVYLTCPACDELYVKGRVCPCQHEPGPYPRWARWSAWLGMVTTSLLLWAGIYVLLKWAWVLVGGA